MSETDIMSNKISTNIEEFDTVTRMNANAFFEKAQPLPEGFFNKELLEAGEPLMTGETMNLFSENPEMFSELLFSDF